MTTGIGIKTFGAYLPYLRIKAEEYQKAWGTCAAGIKEKTVASFDEDPVTMAVAAAREALALVPGAGEEVKYLALASNSLPYAEKAAGGTLIQALGLPGDIFTSEHTTSTAAGMEAFLVAWQYLQTSREESDLALVVVADAPGAMVADNVEHGLGAGAVAFILSRQAPVVVIEGATSAVQDFLGERFRRAGDTNLHDLGVREYSSGSFLKVGQRAVQNLLKQVDRSSSDYQYFITGQHDARLSQNLGRRLGFEEEKIKPALLYSHTGDTGTTSAFLSLAHILANAKPEEKILLLTYGSGAKAMALSLRVTAEINSFRPVHAVNYWLGRKKYIDYIQYLKVRRQIV